MSRSDARGAQVIFAEKAVVSLVAGRMQLQIRCYDADAKLPVVVSFRMESFLLHCRS
jgi:hypothetical protein